MEVKEAAIRICSQPSDQAELSSISVKAKLVSKGSDLKLAIAPGFESLAWLAFDALLNPKLSPPPSNPEHASGASVSGPRDKPVDYPRILSAKWSLAAKSRV